MAASFFPEACGVAHILEWQLLLLKPFMAVHGAQGLLTGGNQVLVLTFTCTTPSSTVHITFATLHSTGCRKPASPLSLGWPFLSSCATCREMQRDLVLFHLLSVFNQLLAALWPHEGHPLYEGPPLYVCPLQHPDLLHTSWIPNSDR